MSNTLCHQEERSTDLTVPPSRQNNVQLQKKLKYLGVTISQDLRWDTHMANITNKASKSLGFVCGNLKVGSICHQGNSMQSAGTPHLGIRLTCLGPPHRQRHRPY
eukprot:TRINITY_DN59954_c0_g1_i1.p1 TRINITY_DN59954_c0_g1~~TRINITY_DN59954_c0_g1_i1.p1  ORF type:complete len:105 (+),score=16.77 TRINITY_DN59954_c0_g1_i1:173-487(+)